MSRSHNVFVDTSIISSDVFKYHDEFYSLVKSLTGSVEAELLRIQNVRTINSFLRINNIFEIFTIDVDEIDHVKRQSCFILNDNTFIIKPGTKAAIEYLRDLFQKKQKEISKDNNSYHLNTLNPSSTRSLTMDTSSQRPDSVITLTSDTIIMINVKWLFVGSMNGVLNMDHN